MGATEDVACKDGLLCQVVPQLERKVGVCDAESADEVSLECLNGLFGSIFVVVVGLDKLDCAILLLHEFFHWGYCLIVCDIESRLEAFISEQLEYTLKCSQYVTIGS